MKWHRFQDGTKCHVDHEERFIIDFDRFNAFSWRLYSATIEGDKIRADKFISGHWRLKEAKEAANEYKLV